MRGGEGIWVVGTGAKRVFMLEEGVSVSSRT